MMCFYKFPEINSWLRERGTQKDVMGGKTAVCTAHRQRRSHPREALLEDSMQSLILLSGRVKY